MTIKKIFLFAIFGLRTLSICSQTNPETNFKDLKTEVKKDNENANAFSFVNWVEFKKYINEIKQDSLSSVTYDYINIIGQIALTSNNKVTKQLVVEMYCRGIYKNAFLNSISINYLRKFKQEDFNDSAKFYLKDGLSVSPNNIGSTAKITAFACGKSCIIDLQNVLAKQGLTKFDKKDIKLALIRAEQTNSEQRLLQSAKEQVINDNFVYNLINDLTYTRNKAIFDYLLDLINRDTKTCNSADNDNPEPMICAFRLIEKVAPYLNNFPAKLNANYELDTKDYALLLSDVRIWIKGNKDTYSLNHNIY